MPLFNGDLPPAVRRLHTILADLVEQSGLSQRQIAAEAGFSKDQLSRTLKGTRHLSPDDALRILRAIGLPARGALTLALFDRGDLAIDWSRSGLGVFLETLITALPEAIRTEIGDGCDRIDPRWGAQVARFVAQRIAHHIGDIREREQRLGEFTPL